MKASAAPRPMSQFGLINVTSTANLNGTLDISLLNSFQPALGQTFSIISSHSESGQFSTLTTPPITAAVTFQSPSYAASGVSIATIKNSSTTVTSSVNPANVGQSITFTATGPGDRTPDRYADRPGNLHGRDNYTPDGYPLRRHRSRTRRARWLSGRIRSPSITPATPISPPATRPCSIRPSCTSLRRPSSSSLNPSVFGQSVTLTATVSSQVSGVGTPAGSVTFMNGSTALQNRDFDQWNRDIRDHEPQDRRRFPSPRCIAATVRLPRARPIRSARPSIRTRAPPPAPRHPRRARR